MMIVVKSPKDLSINKQRERDTHGEKSTAEIQCILWLANSGNSYT